MDFIVNRQNLKNVKLNYDNINATEHSFCDTFGNTPKVNTNFKVCYYNKKLFFAFRVFFDGELPSSYMRKCGKVYRSESIEVMLAFNSKLVNYYSFAVSPYNKTFIGYITNFDSLKPLSLEIEKDLIKSYTEIGSCYYDVILEIPLDKFVDNFNVKTTEVYFNAYRINMEGTKRKSSSLFKTDSISHHVPQSFTKMEIID